MTIKHAARYRNAQKARDTGWMAALGELSRRQAAQAAREHHAKHPKKKPRHVRIAQP